MFVEDDCGNFINLDKFTYVYVRPMDGMFVIAASMTIVAGEDWIVIRSDFDDREFAKCKLREMMQNISKN